MSDTERRSRRGDILPLSCPPRGLSRLEAAAYIGVSPTFFDDLVDEGRMPKPKRINTRRVWDRLALDQAFSALPGEDDDEADSWDDLIREPDSGASDRSARTHGVDITKLSPAERRKALEDEYEEWKAKVRASPLTKRELKVLTPLCTRFGEKLARGTVDQAGVQTMQRLLAHGFVDGEHPSGDARFADTIWATQAGFDAWTAAQSSRPSGKRGNT